MNYTVHRLIFGRQGFIAIILSTCTSSLNDSYRPKSKTSNISWMYAVPFSYRSLFENTSNVMHNDLQPKINTRKKCIKLSAFGHVACIETLCILIKLISIFNCDCSIIYMLFGGKGHFRVNVLWLLWLWVDWIFVWILKWPE